MKKKKFWFALLLISLALTGCESNRYIVNGIDERDANEIIVFLASRGIKAEKVQGASTESAAGSSSITYNISVDENKAIEAMAILNQNGLPRKQGTTLLELFAKQGLMTSDKEENIRYQAGLEEELKNTIMKIDGVLDADVKISFSNLSETTLPGTETPRLKASVYVKHQGLFDDPNLHLESKIKRLVSASIEGLNFEDVAVIADKARFTDINLQKQGQSIGREKKKDHVSIWSIIMTQGSASRFKMIFSLMLLTILGLSGIIVWFVYRFYPKLTKEKPKK